MGVGGPLRKMPVFLFQILLFIPIRKWGTPGRGDLTVYLICFLEREQPEAPGEEVAHPRPLSGWIRDSSLVHLREATRWWTLGWGAPLYLEPDRSPLHLCT